ncbi:neuropeptide SIFamide [Plutella xylostella]|uniref:neuropeptide SIFamide n=1 Tax=Plutella xylostella TaxID=51655 RepID=UPI00203270A1|nr:neuropeptide SIFamide [Plutella xylostella]
MRAAILVCLFSIILCLVQLSTATYRTKTPFNGSMFGKRGATATVDADTTVKNIWALCEIASESCQTWFMQATENK